MMKYRSVWMQEEAKKASNHKNEWNIITGNIIGKYEGYDLSDISPIIGGSQHHLLFFSDNGKNIRVIDIDTLSRLDSLQNDVLPSSENASAWFHALVPLSTNQFFYISTHTNTFVEYNEQKREFVYEVLPPCTFLKSYSKFDCARLDDHIFVFGGYCGGTNILPHIFIYDIHNKLWLQASFQLPSPLSSFSVVAFSVLHRLHFHVIGGEDSQSDAQNTHLLLTQVLHYYTFF
ncbi:hypothetical protein RFI_15510 [Reticulomyxa filosa]|uniref:Uncharacterized protein n=1 Tax=Reticulomyxa filosa TaxID=46433 RepID=X6N6K6_RETFI|nr:hypothetical protein RFI_15510 [Reticulomyxa filosa]|eukprot:ETO21691.1 hypothetical protein RFI_15510 [Reticulomyxa filosa]